ncbi:MAG TPA: hypothetical protein VH309_13895, partial [Elusimicrobiota bacterium]|nr:hypothetical protein [Elusimicrobiota bacterium]
RPQLPAAPLSDEFMTEALGPLSVHGRALVLELLDRMGRREIVGLAAALVKDADGSERVELALALAECGDSRGFAVLEELFRHSLDHPGDSPRAVPLDWITEDTLMDRLGTEAALALRRRLIALEIERRSRTN